MLCWCTASSAQDGSTTDGFAYKGQNPSMEVFRQDGRPFVNPGADVEGTPFFTEEWKFCSITLNSGKLLTNIKTRLNLQSQELHFMDKNNAEMAVPGGLIKNIRFLDFPGSDKVAAEFQTGYPPVDKQDEHSFYQVLSSGKIGLLLFRQKVIVTEKNDLSGEVKKEFVSYETLYLLRKGALERIKKDKSDILNALADKRDMIEEFVKTHKLKYRSFDEIREIVDYYNSIL
jgi:hypothetical protein